MEKHVLDPEKKYKVLTINCDGKFGDPDILIVLNPFNFVQGLYSKFS